MAYVTKWYDELNLSLLLNTEMISIAVWVKKVKNNRCT